MTVTPQNLFSLFSVHVDVQQVKILFNKKENALVQMANGSQAQLATNNLTKHNVHGKLVCITFSKHQNVQLRTTGTQPCTASESQAPRTSRTSSCPQPPCTSATSRPPYLRVTRRPSSIAPAVLSKGSSSSIGSAG